MHCYPSPHPTPPTPLHLHTHRVIKRILPSDDFDIDLDQDLYVLYGKRSINATTLRTIDSHDSDPLISKKKINVAHDNGSASGENKLFKDALVKTHSALMLVTWPLLVVSGIFFPVFMKPALPGGGWFQVISENYACNYRYVFQSILL